MKKIKSGFTLIELLIYMALLSVLIVILTQIFVSVIDAKLETESIASIERDGNYILSRLIYDISQSNGIVTPSGIGGQGSTLQISINGVSNTYSLSGNNLQVTNAGGTYRLNGYNSNISNLSFTRIGPGDSTDTIQFSFTVTSQVQRRTGSESKIYQSTAASRQ